jgi:2-C-methyl-D-erythritol 4-phosphate cytidylyltransferase
MTSTQSQQRWAIVPAAGSGQRYSAELPKQYANLANKAVLQHSLEALLDSALFTGVVVALAMDDQRFETLPAASDSRIVSCIGGASRAQSVLNALQALKNKAQPDDWVMVHDAARPLVRSATIKKLYDTLCDDAIGGILAAPMHDTLKQTHANTLVQPPVIEQTLDRANIWAAQTPQMFRYQMLSDALKNALLDDAGIGITDEASALEKSGYKVRLVQGERSNFKITTSEDMTLASFYIKLQDSMKDKVKGTVKSSVRTTGSQGAQT